MRAHTRKRRTKDSELVALSREEKSISADEHIRKVYGDFPRWAISLAGLRHREGLTQKQLGDLISVKQTNISLMERGLRPIGKNIAQRLAKVFKMRLFHTFGLIANLLRFIANLLAHVW